MIPLPLSPKIINKGKNQGVFEIDGLYPGYGVTVGNALRRVLLSSLEGVAVTEVKIKGALHEFSTMSGILEDVTIIILKLKNLRFKIYEGDTHKVELKVKGEKEVKGSDFKMFPQIELVNPEFHLATITDRNKEFEMEIKIEKGIGYEPKEHRKIKKEAGVLQKKSEIGMIALDAIFTPIRNVNFQVENMRVGDRTDFDKLSLEIETDGTLTPEEAFYKACEILLQHFNLIFEGKKSELPPIAKDNKYKSASEESDVIKISIEDLKLSAKTLNVLQENSIKTVGGVIKKSEESLSELKGVGDKTISEIKRKLKKLGLELKTE